MRQQRPRWRRPRCGAALRESPSPPRALASPPPCLTLSTPPRQRAFSPSAGRATCSRPSTRLLAATTPLGAFPKAPTPPCGKVRRTQVSPSALLSIPCAAEDSGLVDSHFPQFRCPDARSQLPSRWRADCQPQVPRPFIPCLNQRHSRLVLCLTRCAPLPGVRPSRNGEPYVALLARPTDAIRPEDFVAFYCDGSFGALRAASVGRQ